LKIDFSYFSCGVFLLKYVPDKYFSGFRPQPSDFQDLVLIHLNEMLKKMLQLIKLF